MYCVNGPGGSGTSHRPGDWGCRLRVPDQPPSLAAARHTHGLLAEKRIAL